MDGLTIGNDFTSDVNVRRAINLAIDRESMIENVLGGHRSAAYSVCDGMPWYSEENEVSYDQDAAKKLLEEAGWLEGADGIRKKDGVRAEITLIWLYNDLVIRRGSSESVLRHFNTVK